MAAFRSLVCAAIDLSLVGILLAGLSTLFARSYWIADLAANLRVQWVLAGVVAVAICWMSRRWFWLAIQMLMLLLHLSWAFAAPTHAPVTSAQTELTVSSVNVFIHNHDYDTIAEVLTASSADVIAVFEISEALCQCLVSAMNDSHPFVEAHPLPHPFGVVVFSRYPLQEIRTIGLDHTGGSMMFSVESNAHRYRIAAVHPVSPMSAADFAARHSHLQLAVEDLSRWHHENPGGSLVMIGDFNLTPWSPWFADLLENSRLSHVAVGHHIDPSWHAWPLFPFGLVLDHCLISSDLQVFSARYGPSVNSDHELLTVELSPQR